KELLYTIAHKMGKPSSTEVFTDSQLHQYIQEVNTLASHIAHNMATVLSPPVYCLMATVKEAKEILGKDISGFSDPYCMLTIMEDEKESRTRRSRAKPSKSIVKEAVSNDKIYQSDIKKQTLNPIWNQTFIIEFEDIAGASFHLEMWDKDEEVSLTQKLEEITSNFSSLKRMIKEAKKEKGTDDFLGKVVIKLQDLHCTEDNWYNLEPRTETYPDRGQCHLNLKFIHKARDGTLSAGRSAYINYCGILQQFVQAYISKQQVKDERTLSLKKCIPFESLTFFALSLQTNSSRAPKWVAYSKLYQSLEVDSSVLFQQLTSVEYHWHQQELPYQQKQELGDSLHGFLQYGLCLVAKYRDIFPPTPSATPKLHTLLRYTCFMFELSSPTWRSWLNVSNNTNDIIIIRTDKVSTPCVGTTCRVLNFSSWISCIRVFFGPVVGRCLLSCRPFSLRKDEAARVSYRTNIKMSGVLTFRGSLELTNFQEGFREALPYWLNQAFSTTQDRVERAVQVDQLQPLQSGAVPIKHSSSAVDLVACIQPVCQLWEQLSWPDPEEAFMLMVKLTEDVCKIVVNYCHTLKERVRVLSENSDHGRAINMLCVVVNDLEHLRLVLTRLPTQLNWAGLRDRTRTVIGESQFQNTLPSQLQQAQGVLGREIRSALDTLGKKVIPSKSTEDAADPLMRYLERELHYMNENLVQENFNSLLTPLWNNSVKILYQVASQHPQQGGLMVFCQRLLYTLQCLEQCFLAEGNGLPSNTLHSDEYKENMGAGEIRAASPAAVKKQPVMVVHPLSPFQNVNSSEKYGAVTLLASYSRSDQRLRVEVLNAVNLLPMDSNGLSDPFVQLCLEPNHTFPVVEPRCTRIKSCDLNPLFEEAFEFLVSLSQCQAPGACLVVTVLDHDTLMTDDFEGEAFLALKAIPGVAGERKGDGLSSQPDAVAAQIRLPLMHPKPNGMDTILTLLESRRGERDAQAYVKKRRQREKQSQEGIQP
uniref:Unc-13 homolog D n=1 Tax=Cyclopterus lumpus TaxID=8103 RepID=A0A8C3ASU8_CYCLU